MWYVTHDLSSTIHSSCFIWHTLLVTSCHAHEQSVKWDILISKVTQQEMTQYLSNITRVIYSRWLSNLPLVRHHVSQSLVVDYTKKNVSFHFTTIDTTVHFLCAVIIVASCKINNFLIKYHVHKLTLLSPCNFHILRDKSLFILF